MDLRRRFLDPNKTDAIATAGNAITCPNVTPRFLRDDALRFLGMILVTECATLAVPTTIFPATFPILANAIIAAIPLNTKLILFLLFYNACCNFLLRAQSITQENRYPNPHIRRLPRSLRLPDVPQQPVTRLRANFRAPLFAP